MKSPSPSVTYTAVFGNYDRIPGVNPDWGCDFVCFTDSPELVSYGWRVVHVNLNGESPAQANRRYKMLPHVFLPMYERSLYIDGNIRITEDPSSLFEKYLTHGMITIPHHQERACAYEEAKACIESGYIDRETAERQMERYAMEGFPRSYGLTANGTIFRNHMNESIILLMNAWWSEYCSGAKRDQLSLQYLTWKLNVRVTEMEEVAQKNKRFFKIAIHKALRRKSAIGKIVDYISSNRYKNIWFSSIHNIIHKFNTNKLLRFLAR